MALSLIVKSYLNAITTSQWTKQVKTWHTRKRNTQTNRKGWAWRVSCKSWSHILVLVLSEGNLGDVYFKVRLGGFRDAWGDPFGLILLPKTKTRHFGHSINSSRTRNFISVNYCYTSLERITCSGEDSIPSKMHLSKQLDNEKFLFVLQVWSLTTIPNT